VAGPSGQGVTGVTAYSEGVFRGRQQGPARRLGSGRFQTADEVLRTTPGDTSAGCQDGRGVGRLLKAWGRPFAVDPHKSGEVLAALPQKNAQRQLRDAPVGTQSSNSSRSISGSGPGTDWTPNAGRGRTLLGRPGERSSAACGACPATSHLRPPLHAAALVPELAKYQSAHRRRSARINNLGRQFRLKLHVPQNHTS
jgi:hypothetical protein